MRYLYILFLLNITLFAISEQNTVITQHELSIKLENNNLKLEVFKNEIKNNVASESEKQNLRLENTLNQIDSVKDRIDNISNSVDRFGILVAFFGVLVTLLVIYFSFKSTSEARAEIQNWINENGEKFINKELQPIIDSFDENSKIMKKELVKLKDQSNLEIEQLKNQLNEKGNEFLDNLSSKISENDITTNEFSIEDKRYFESQIKAIKYKSLNERTFQDYKKLILFDIASKNYKKAIERIDRLLQNNYSDKEEAWLFFLKGTVYEKQYDYDNALDCINESIKLFPSFVKAYTAKAKIFNIERQEYKEAIKLSKKAIELNNQDYDAYIGLGYAIRNKAVWEKEPKYFKEAIEINKKAIEINPDLELAYNNIGSIYRMLNDYENAKKWYKKSIDANPNDWVYNNLFMIQLISNKPFEQELEQNYLNQFKNIESKNFAIYKMLKILQDIKNRKLKNIEEIKNSIINWSQIYTLRHFTFEPLENWVDEEKNEEIKKNLNEAVTLFKTYRIKSIYDKSKDKSSE